MLRKIMLCFVTCCVALAVVGCSPGVRPPVVPEASAEELAAQAKADRERALSELQAQFPDVLVPEVAIVRYVSLDEWAEVVASCLQDEGFVAEASSGGISSAPSPGQEEPFAIANYVCTLKYPIDPRSNIPLNDDQIRYLYDYYTRVMTSCLQGEGYDVPAAPSLERYVEQYGQEGSWNPYELVAAAVTTDDEWERVNRKCPQVPGDLYG